MLELVNLDKVEVVDVFMPTSKGLGAIIVEDVTLELEVLVPEVETEIDTELFVFLNDDEEVAESSASLEAC
jgi:hypothetical protein